MGISKISGQKFLEHNWTRIWPKKQLHVLNKLIQEGYLSQAKLYNKIVQCEGRKPLLKAVLWDLIVPFLVQYRVRNVITLEELSKRQLEKRRTNAALEMLEKQCGEQVPYLKHTVIPPHFAFSSLLHWIGAHGIATVVRLFLLDHEWVFSRDSLVRAVLASYYITFCSVIFSLLPAGFCKDLATQRRCITIFTCCIYAGNFIVQRFVMDKYNEMVNVPVRYLSYYLHLSWSSIT